jgi:hypothetical protein
LDVIVEHLREGQLEYELDKCDELRDPPVPVTAWLHIDSAAHDGLLYGWSANPNGANDGWRGLIFLIREFAPGFSAKLLTWVRAEGITRLA